MQQNYEKSPTIFRHKSSQIPVADIVRTLPNLPLSLQHLHHHGEEHVRKLCRTVVIDNKATH